LTGRLSFHDYLAVKF